MATHSSILPWKIPWTEEPGELRGVAQSQTCLKQFIRHTQVKPKHVPKLVSYHSPYFI